MAFGEFLGRGDVEYSVAVDHFNKQQDEQLKSEGERDKQE